MDTRPELKVYMTFLWPLGRHINVLWMFNLNLAGASNESDAPKYEWNKKSKFYEVTKEFHYDLMSF